MLVLSRKLGEKIILDTPTGDIVLCITGIAGNTVRVGIEAPQDVHIFREELLNDNQS
jgi:carbon storage regulator